jgi:hypothetical protein
MSGPQIKDHFHKSFILGNVNEIYQKYNTQNDLYNTLVFLFLNF